MSLAVETPAPLWSRREATIVGAVLALGAVLVLAGWYFAAGRADAGDQLVFVSLALVGALVGLAAVTGWVARGRRALSARRSLLLGEAPPPSTGTTASAELVAAPTGKWFHRADCLLAHGRGWSASPRDDHEAAGRLACPGCRP